jgi:hypothetical protein
MNQAKQTHYPPVGAEFNLANMCALIIGTEMPSGLRCLRICVEHIAFGKTLSLLF